MTPMHWLWLAATAMLLLSLAALLLPLLRESSAPPAEQDARALRALYRGQMAELERERQRGTLGEAEHQQAVDELHRRLLLELDRGAAPAAWQHSPWLRRGSALLLAVLLPAASFALYQKLGDPRAAARLTQAADDGHGAGDAQILAMVDGLAARLRAEPQNLGGWVMLARSYETLERFDAAANAYGQALLEARRSQAGPEDQARLLAEQADALASAQGGDLEGAAGLAIAEALRLDPAQPKALALAGSAAARRGDLQLAQQHWRALLAQLEPGSELAMRVQDDLLKLESSQLPAPSPAPALALSGRLQLPPGMDAAQLPAGAMVYAVVRAVDQRPPVAVLRMPAAQLPMDFHIGPAQLLDPGSAIKPGQRLQLQARLSTSGAAMPQTGDLYSQAVTVAAHKSGLALQLQNP